MDAFNYLSVLISIILGLGITQILSAFGRLLNARARVRWYAPAVAWAALLLLIHVQTWWAMFGLRTYTAWSFRVFLVVLSMPIMLYLMAALALPDAGGDTPIDLKANYYAHATWFFSLAVLVILASLVRPVVLYGSFRLDADHLFQAVFLAGCAGAILTKREHYHVGLAGIAAVLLAIYATVLFGRLR